ncbi:unnamed protein product [Vicia faba]|uniref:Uncharacterized protein n=1 Tax=Vicia faba TaxID=3906 RepID=A0AAV0Z9Y3_VICFA|nr:unnamed protein product [Vicia faba]
MTVQLHMANSIFFPLSFSIGTDGGLSLFSDPNHQFTTVLFSFPDLTLLASIHRCFSSLISRKSVRELMLSTSHLKRIAMHIKARGEKERRKLPNRDSLVLLQSDEDDKKSRENSGTLLGSDSPSLLLRFCSRSSFFPISSF